MSEFNQSCTSCTKDNQQQGSGEVYNCPLLMQDGRSFGDKVYSARCQQQYQVQFDKSIKSSYEYRQYLINNAEALMKQNSTNAFRSFHS